MVTEGENASCLPAGDEFCALNPSPGIGVLSAMAAFGANSIIEAAAVKAAYIPAFLRASFLDIFSADNFSVVVFIFLSIPS